jgi:hypothetical protein
VTIAACREWLFKGGPEHSTRATSSRATATCGYVDMYLTEEKVLGRVVDMQEGDVLWLPCDGDRLGAKLPHWRVGPYAVPGGVLTITADCTERDTTDAAAAFHGGSDRYPRDAASADDCDTYWEYQGVGDGTVRRGHAWFVPAGEDAQDRCHCVHLGDLTLPVQAWSAGAGFRQDGCDADTAWFVLADASHAVIVLSTSAAAWDCWRVTGTMQLPRQATAEVTSITLVAPTTVCVGTADGTVAVATLASPEVRTLCCGLPPVYALAAAWMEQDPTGCPARTEADTRPLPHHALPGTLETHAPPAAPVVWVVAACAPDRSSPVAVCAASLVVAPATGTEEDHDAAAAHGETTVTRSVQSRVACAGRRGAQLLSET